MDNLIHVSVESLFRDMSEQLGLQWVAGHHGGGRTLSSETIQKPTLALIGHLNVVHPNRVQVLGCAEMDYLRGLSEPGQQDAIDHLFSTELAAIVVSNGESVPAVLRDSAERTETPLFVAIHTDPSARTWTSSIQSSARPSARLSQKFGFSQTSASCPRSRTAS
jgi:HPr kinase/phosphorylase